MSLYQAFNRDADRGPQPRVKIRPLYQVLAEQASEFESAKSIATNGGIPTMVAGLHQRVTELSQMVDGLREQLESLQNANYIAKFPFRYQPPMVVNPEDQAREFYMSITTEKDRELVESSSRLADVVKFRHQIVRRLLDFGISDSMVAKIIKKDRGTVYYHALPDVAAQRRKRNMQNYNTKKGIKPQ